MKETQLVKTIKAHIAAGDKAAEKSNNHYIAAGQHLKTLKASHGGTWAEWEALLRDKIGIGKSRASELMAIADGRKTVESARAATAYRVRRLRSSPLRNGENAASPEAIADARKAVYADDDDPGDSDETIWRRGLLNRAAESAGHAFFEDWSAFTVDDEVLAAARVAAKAWAKTADYLQRLCGKLPAADSDIVRTTEAAEPPAPAPAPASVPIIEIPAPVDPWTGLDIPDYLRRHRVQP
jgi:hypothetical protein